VVSTRKEKGVWVGKRPIIETCDDMEAVCVGKLVIREEGIGPPPLLISANGVVGAKGNGCGVLVFPEKRRVISVLGKPSSNLSLGPTGVFQSPNRSPPVTLFAPKL